MWSGGVALVLVLGAVHVAARAAGARAAADLSKAMPIVLLAGLVATEPAPGGLALAGALLFMLSDGLLATDRFARRFAAADAALMTTYYAAQTLIALSVRG